MEQTDSSSPSSKASSMDSGPNSLASGSPTLITLTSNDSPAPPVFHSWNSSFDIYNHQHHVPHFYPPTQQQYTPLGFNFPGVHWPDPIIPNPYSGVLNTTTTTSTPKNTTETTQIVPINPYPPTVVHPQKKATFPPKRRNRKSADSEETRIYKQPFSDIQRSVLMERFRKGYKINLDERKSLGAKIGLTHEQVRTWFANQRAREKAAEKQRLMKIQLLTVDPEKRMDQWESHEQGYRIERIT